ncbi:BLOC-1-related complex subunit 8 isoform X5 [Prionailurus viverrinus]|uniref:BLOC-1-related complex subunit 8 isoform X5 n=1 Tax=Prionailurus viverrinus TaxID=61388 RepID=UPI001FF35985|nr:BLOC-1-related complex subunit 8 isoform X5 [Prionailurus viverrinus]XP_047700855.1 BLOC-1-related complex subunit 8 isoform X5 [Prionailurus viverrinus]
MMSKAFLDYLLQPITGTTGDPAPEWTLDTPRCSGWTRGLSSQESYALSLCVSAALPLLCHPPPRPPTFDLLGPVTDKFTESVYVLANEPSVALYRLQEHVRRSLPELAQHKADMQRWEEQSQGAIYTVEYACSAVKNLVDSSVYFRSVEGLLKQAISIRDHMNAAAQSHSPDEPPLPSSA